MILLNLYPKGRLLCLNMIKHVHCCLFFLFSIFGDISMPGVLSEKLSDHLLFPTIVASVRKLQCAA